MRNLLARAAEIFRTMAASFRWVSKQVWDGTKFVMESVMERVVQPAVAAGAWTFEHVIEPATAAAAFIARPVVKTATGTLVVAAFVSRPLVTATSATAKFAWNHIGRPAVALADGVLGLPGRVLGGVGGGGSGPKSADAANAAANSAKQQGGKADDVARAIERAQTFMAAAEARFCSDPGWVERFSAKLGESTLRYISKLDMSECKAIMKSDPRDMAAFLRDPSGCPLAGVRSPAEVSRDITDRQQQAPVAPSPAPQSEAWQQSAPAGYTGTEHVVLSRLAERLKPRKAADGEDFEDPEPMFKPRKFG